MPSRMAARSRGPPRPTTRRASERARSGAALSRARISSRAAASADQHLHRIEPARDRLRIGQRRGQPLREQPRARRRHGAVDGGEQRAAPFAGERAHEFEIGARRLVDRERRAGGLAHRRRQRQPLAELRALDIGDDGGSRGQLEPRQRAERLAGGDREIGGEPPLGGRAVEHVAGERRHRRQLAQPGREIGVGIERVGDDDLARLEPRDLGREAGTVAFGDAELARSRCRSRRARTGCRSPSARARSPADSCCAARRAACPR